MDVAAWLRGLGLGEYEAAFRENRIDADILAELNDGDLKPIRRRMNMTPSAPSEGLAIVEAAPKLVTAAGSPLHVRVGIAIRSNG